MSMTRSFPRFDVVVLVCAQFYTENKYDDTADMKDSDIFSMIFLVGKNPYPWFKTSRGQGSRSH